MKFSTIIFASAAAIVSVYAAPTFEKRGVDPALVPDFGIQRGAGADGTGYALLLVHCTLRFTDIPFAATAAVSTASSSPAHARLTVASSSTYVCRLFACDSVTDSAHAELERERRCGPCYQQPWHRDAVPDWQLEARATGAYRDPALDAPEPPRSWCRLPRGVDRLRPAPATDQRTSVKCLRRRVPLWRFLGDRLGYRHGRVMLVSTFNRRVPVTSFQLSILRA